MSDELESKVCSRCGRNLPLSNFYKDRTHADGHKSACKTCYDSNNKTQPTETNDEIMRRANNIYQNMAAHARKRNVPFDREWFTVEKIYNIIKHKHYCECCGKLMKKTVSSEGAHNDTITFDRFDSNKGYTRDNIKIICWRCNHIKNDAATKEIKKVSDWMIAVDELNK